VDSNPMSNDKVANLEARLAVIEKRLKSVSITRKLNYCLILTKILLENY